MLIDRMNATFGKLRDSSLELKDGLNILEAPNEAGKSTWCAFLLSMLYGAGGGEEQNRYAPWSGESMGGEIHCRALGKEITLRRSTARPDRPMEEFQAVDTDTGADVPELTAAACGEALLGVTREVYERSAFIRQAGLPITQDAEMEQRIDSLILSDEVKSITERLSELRERLDHLEQREAALNEELDLMDRWEAAKNRQALSESKNAAIRAEEYAAALRRELDQRGVPELDAISRMRGAIVNLRTARKLIQKAEAEQEDAERILREAEQAAEKSPFAGRTPDEAERLPPTLPPRPVVPILLKIYLILCAVTPISLFFFRPPWPLIVLYVLAALAGVVTLWLIHERQSNWDSMAARRLKRRKMDLERYAALYHAVQNAKKEAALRAAATESLRASLASNEKALLREVSRFAPGVANLSAADEQLRDAARRRKELTSILSGAKDANFQRAPEPPLPPPPTRDREEAILALASLREELATVRAESESLSGRLRTINSGRAETSDEDARSQTAALLQESEVIRLALDSLNRANAALNAPFSTSLEQRTSEIFNILTEGQYSGVALDQALHISTQAGDAQRRDALVRRMRGSTLFGRAPCHLRTGTARRERRADCH